MRVGRLLVASAPGLVGSALQTRSRRTFGGAPGGGIMGQSQHTFAEAGSSLLADVSHRRKVSAGEQGRDSRDSEAASDDSGKLVLLCLNGVPCRGLGLAKPDS